MIRQTLHIDDFDFEAGGHLPGIDVVFHTSRQTYTKGDHVVWICHALTANSDVQDWWPQLVGPGKYFDTQKSFIVCVNMLGSPYGSSSPASPDPRTGLPYKFDFPRTTIRDMIGATIAVRKHLGIETIDLLVGSSIGGFQAIEWAVTEPDVFRKAVFMATAPRVSPWLSAQAEAQRMALEADQTFREEGSGLDGGAAGLRCARAQALISYRSHAGYGQTQAEDDPDTLFAGRAASYERYQGEKLVRRSFDAYSYYYLTYSLDSHNVGRGRGGVASALARIKADTVVIAIDSDGIFPPEEAQGWYGSIPGAKLKIISSDFGHDGFLLENGQITSILDEHLCKF